MLKEHDRDAHSSLVFFRVSSIDNERNRPRMIIVSSLTSWSTILYYPLTAAVAIHPEAIRFPDRNARRVVTTSSTSTKSGYFHVFLSKASEKRKEAPWRPAIKNNIYDLINWQIKMEVAKLSLSPPVFLGQIFFVECFKFDWALFFFLLHSNACKEKSFVSKHWF